jgi:hypothetical protein
MGGLGGSNLNNLLYLYYERTLLIDIKTDLNS